MPPPPRQATMEQGLVYCREVIMAAGSWSVKGMRGLGHEGVGLERCRWVSSTVSVGT